MKNRDQIVSAKTEAAAAMEAGAALTEHVHMLDLVAISSTATATKMTPLLSLPGGKLEDLSKYLPAPLRVTGRRVIDTPADFIEYVNLFGLKTATMIFADISDGQFLAILDYSESLEKPSWGHATASMTLKTTPAWVEWTASNKKAMTQEAFAAFLEEHMLDITTPNYATLKEMVLNFEVKKDVAFNSMINRSNGAVQLTYNEEVAGGLKGGDMAMPTEIVVALAPYYGTERYAVEARLRYRVSGGKLSIWYELVRIQDLLETVFTAIVANIKTKTADHARTVLRAPVD